MALFKGAGVALVTPMHKDGTVNFEVLRLLLEEQIAGGTDAIISMGTTGEAATLSVEEHLEVIRYTVEVVKHRIPVIAGTVPNPRFIFPKRRRKPVRTGCCWSLLTTTRRRRTGCISILRPLLLR